MRFDISKFLLVFAFMVLTEINLLSATDKSAVNLCKKNIDRIEKDLILPPGLLEAIALTESGRRHKETRQFVAWPWTLNVDGKPEYHQTKTDAVKALEGHLRNGITNIDVGCMQINYRHHGSQFKSPAYMLDPRRNVVYAGHFLNQLNQRFQSWTKSIGFYHSATLKYQVPYRKKVYKLWRQIQTNQTLFAGKPFGTNSEKPRWLKSVLDLNTDQDKQNLHPNQKQFSPLITTSSKNAKKPSFVLETEGKWIVVKMNPKTEPEIETEIEPAKTQSKEISNHNYPNKTESNIHAHGQRENLTNLKEKALGIADHHIKPSALNALNEIQPILHKPNELSHNEQKQRAFANMHIMPTNQAKANDPDSSLASEASKPSSQIKNNNKSKTTTSHRSPPKFQTLDDILSKTRHPNQIEFQKPRVLSEVQ